MIEILKLFIETSSSMYYITLFQHIIKNYLDDPFVLDYVLKSHIVKNVGIIGKTGAKCFLFSWSIFDR